jgi:PAS domain S-box-containing protein
MSPNRGSSAPTNRELAVRLAVSRALGRTRDLDGVYAAALDTLVECLAVSRASVLLFDGDGVMRFKAYRGLSSAYRAAVEGHSPWTPDSTDARPLLVPDVTREPTLQSYLPVFARERIAALAFIPLVSLGRVIGKFMLYYDAPHVFDSEEVELATVIAAAVAFAVERGRAEEVADRQATPAGFEPKATASSRDVSAPSQAEEFQAGQHQVLEMIATGAPLQHVLTLLVHLIEDQCEGIVGCVMLLDPDGTHVRLGAGPSLPGKFAPQIDGLPLTARVGCCGSVMLDGSAVVVTDIESDPRCDDACNVALAGGLRACWATPIFSQHKRVLGSFAMFCSTARGPSREELRLLEIAADLAGAAIDHQRSQDALRQSEERNRAILRAIPDWMFVLSRDGVFLDYHVKNPEALLVPPDQFLGKSMHQVLPTWLADAHQRMFELALATNERELLEYSLEMQDERRFYEACIVPYDSDKLLTIVRDITDRKRAELDAAAQRHELAHLNRVLILAEQSGALAHELSQPLAAILSNAQAARRLLEQNPLDLDELRAALDDVIRNDRRAGAVIHRLRELLKKNATVLQPLDVNEITLEALDLTRSDLLLRRVPITTGLSTGIPSVLGDRIQLQQVILNLVLNACDAMSTVEPAEREIRLTTVADDSFVQIAIADRGVGIPEDQLDSVFEPFVTHRTQGLGLGLAISRSIVQAHRGRIEAENNADGPGATFRCFFPVAATTDAGWSATAAQAPSIGM